ncbi:sensor histidine kinase [Oceanobacillus zhaokaii]|uniref:histidine kinase n=1 Tax=Oceanobacillus zhaokaii TaxID=2052660 RepID=A0A345PEB1_9BACI|nr:HAMP domain-containing sensor histidine kinase [Oceanobacillus zhaokaii]AXI08341.1 sensor histidine kinase [Oceanobacillus zhaokaii]
MKIKNWLMISYFIVMVLPIAALYFLYVSLSHYDQKIDFQEYMDFQDTVSNIESHLLDESLYKIQSNKNYEHLESLVNDNLKIDLYRYDGFQLFSSMDFSNSYSNTTSGVLYQNVNEVQKSPRTYSVKKLVFDKDNRIAGVYEITVSRKEWIEAYNRNTIIMISLFSIFFIALYSIIIILLNRKLNRPLQALQAHMNAFAKGKELEQSLSISKDEIGELMIHFEEMKSQINQTKDALAAQQQEKEFMIASLSHDLKTPLTVIRTYSEALENNNLTEEVRREYKLILFEKLDHMKLMIEDLALYTSLQSSQNKINPVQVNGNEFFDMLFSGYEELCANKEISLVMQQEVKHSYFLDPKQMIRIVDNLMDNSIRYTPKNGTIWLAAISSRKPIPDWIFGEFRKELEDWSKEGTAILIQNEGRAIPKLQLDRIFQPFYQADKSRGKGATSGLGLSIAKIIMERHDGKIKVWSAENKGTLIACWLKER